MCQRILKRKRCVYNTGRSCQAHISCRLVGHTTDSSPTPTSSSLTGSCSDFQEDAQACYNDLGDMSDSIGNITLKTNRCVLSRKLSEITHLGNHFFLFRHNKTHSCSTVSSPNHVCLQERELLVQYACHAARVHIFPALVRPRGGEDQRSVEVSGNCVMFLLGPQGNKTIKLVMRRRHSSEHQAEHLSSWRPTPMSQVIKATIRVSFSFSCTKYVVVWGRTNENNTACHNSRRNLER